MTKIIKLWHKTSFWTRVEKTFLYVGSTITGTMVQMEANKILILVVIVSTIIGGAVGFWFNDENKDGIADIYQ
jgi:hypothetical protein